MTVINRVRVAWTGFTGGPGVSTFYFSESTVPGGSLRTFFQSFTTFCPNTVTINFPTTGDQIEDSDGTIVGVWTAAPTTPITGVGGATGYSGTSGMCVDWLTGTVVAGRRPMGRTFIVPLASVAYQNDGTISDTLVTSVLAAANTMITAFGDDFLIWSRPFAGRAASPGPPPVTEIPARDGLAVPVVGAKVPDLAVVLRSRRR